MLYNTVFSLLPNLVLGIFDQDLNDEMSVAVPQIYLKGIRQELYNMEVFWAYIADGMYQSFVLYFTSSMLFQDAGVDPAGLNANRDEIGTYLSFFCVVTVNIYLALNNFTWNWVTHVTLYATLLVFFVYVGVYLASAQFTGMVDFLHPTLVDRIFKVPAFYLSLLFAVVTSLLPRMILKYTQSVVWPSDTDILQEYQTEFWKRGVAVDLAHGEEWRGMGHSNGRDQKGMGEEWVVAKEHEERRAEVPSTRHKRTASVISRTGSIPEEMFFSPVQYTGNPDTIANDTMSTTSDKPTPLLTKLLRPLRGLIKKASGTGVQKEANVVYMEGDGKEAIRRKNTGYAFAHEENYGEELGGKIL
jgi:hypothetical protein